MKIICTISIIFTILVLSGVTYMYFADPFGINVFLFPSKVVTTNTNNNVNASSNSQKIKVDSININKDTNINLSPAQEDALNKIGIDPSTVPSTITSAQGKCFTDKLGEKRTSEILAGAIPSAFELLKVKACL